MKAIKLPQLKRFLNKQRYVRLTYIFGSFAKGKAGPLSDIDIACLLDESLGTKERHAKGLFLASTIQGILKKDVDIVILNDAPLLLAFNVIKHGILLRGDANKKVMFEARIMDEYFDRMHFDEIYFRELETRIKTRGLL